MAIWVTRPTSATAMNVAAKSRVMLGAPPVRMGLHNMRATCTFQAVRPQTLRLIGLGAIGGSVGRQVKQTDGGQGGSVIGWSPEPAERARAPPDWEPHDSPPRAVDVPHPADLPILS